MKLFNLKPHIYKYENVKDFVEFFNINEEDFILTHELLYNNFLKHLCVKAEVLFQEKYGTEPTDEMINNIIKDLKRTDYKRIFAIGGGSVIDIAKILILKDANNVIDLFERNVPIIKEKKLIAVPTTCGTGSEVTNITIAEIKSKQTKMGLVADELLPDYAVMIPELVKGLPYKFFVYSSIDALIHAVESFVAPRSNPYTELFSLKAIEMIIKGYLQIIEKGEGYRREIIEDFLIASNYAGISFGNTGVGAVHALSYPLGGKYHVPHGEANYQFFTEVFKLYNKLRPEGKIKQVNGIITNLLKLDVQEDVNDALDVLLSKLLTKKQLREYGMLEEEIEFFADSVIKKQQRLLANNYTPLTRDEIRDIYKKLY